MIRPSYFRSTARPVADPRRALAAIAEVQRVPLGRLARLIGRDRSYLQRFVNQGVPAALSERDHELLAAYLGAGQDGLGVRTYWTASPD